MKPLLIANYFRRLTWGEALLCLLTRRLHVQVVLDGNGAMSMNVRAVEWGGGVADDAA